MCQYIVKDITFSNQDSMSESDIIELKNDFIDLIFDSAEYIDDFEHAYYASVDELEEYFKDYWRAKGIEISYIYIEEYIDDESFDECPNSIAIFETDTNFYIEGYEDFPLLPQNSFKRDSKRFRDFFISTLDVEKLVKQIDCHFPQDCKTAKDRSDYAALIREDDQRVLDRIESILENKNENKKYLLEDSELISLQNYKRYILGNCPYDHASSILLDHYQYAIDQFRDLKHQ